MRWWRWRDRIACRDAVALIADYLDDALPQPQRGTLERHLRDCPHCAEYVRQIRTTIGALNILEPDTIEPAVRDELVALYRRWRSEDG
jgi:anti-sigma factor RsiW